MAECANEADAIRIARLEEQLAASRAATAAYEGNSEKIARLEERILAIQMAINKSETVLNDYKVTSNEWRGTLADTTAKMLTRIEYEAKHDALEQIVGAVSARVTLIEGNRGGSTDTQASTRMNLNLMIGGLGLAIAAMLAVYTIVHASSPQPTASVPATTVTVPVVPSH